MNEYSDEQEFEGIYVAHWEIARFVIQTSKGIVGRPRFENWKASFPKDYVWAHDDAHSREGTGRAYRMRVRGRLGPPGHFGHRGLCTRELHIVEVLECEETDSPGPTW